MLFGEVANWAISCLLLSLRVAPVFALAPPFNLVALPMLFRVMLGLALSVCLVSTRAHLGWLEKSVCPAFKKRAALMPSLMLLSIVGAGLGAVPAHADDKNSPELNKCISKIQNAPNGSRWPGFVACQKTELSAQDKHLNSVYSSLKAAAAKLGPKAGQSLVFGQRQWVAYRDSWCAFEGGNNAPPNPEVNELFCKIELTKMQAARIGEQLDELR